MGSMAARSSALATRAASGLLALGMAAIACIAAAPAQAQGNCVTVTRSFPQLAFEPGEQNFQVRVTVNSSCAGEVYALGLREDLPEGWSFVEIVGQDSTIPQWNTESPEVGGIVEFAWFPVPSFPFSFTYTVNVPANEDAAQNIQGSALFRVLDGNQLTTTSSSTAQLSVPPDLTLFGGDITLNCGEEFIEPGYSAIDPVDGDISDQVTVAGSVDTNQAGTYTLLYQVQNSFQKGDTAQRTVTVLDVDPPSLQVLGDRVITIECGNPFNDPGATGFDVCQGDITPNRIGAVNVNSPGTYTLTYVAEDAGGNTSSPQNRTVIVRDTRPPSLALIGAASVNLECGTPYTDLGVTATDTCEGNISGDVTVNASAVRPSVPGTYTVTYNVEDSSGNVAQQITRSVVVRDTRKPTITLIGPASLTLQCGSVYTDLGATAFDACAGSLPVTVDASGLDMKRPGVQKVRYSVNDGVTGATFLDRTINVVDFEAPTLTLLGASTMEIDCGSVFDDPGVTAADTCDTDLDVVVGGDTVDTSKPGSYRVSYSVEDVSGNSKSVSRLVVVRDKSAPVVVLLGQADVTIECSEPYEEPGASVLDACDGDLTSRLVIGGDRVNISQPGTYTVRYTATDSNNNTSTAVTRTVRVVDSKRPVIQVLGADETIACGEDYVDEGAVANDNCGGSLTSAIRVTGNDFDSTEPGVYSITYTVADASANTATATRTVTVLEAGCAVEGEGEGTPEGEGEGSVELPPCAPESITLIEPAANAIIPFGTQRTEVSLKSTVSFTSDPPCEVPENVTVLYSIDGVAVGTSQDRAGGYPVEVELGVGTYVVAATAMPADRSKAVSTVQTFSVIVAVDNDANGILDNPFVNMPGNGDRWASLVQTGEGCLRAVEAVSFTLDAQGEVVAEVANPANETQVVVVKVDPRVLAVGEHGILVVTMACNLNSLFDPYDASQLFTSLPTGTLAGQPFIDVSIIATSDGGATFRQMDTVEVDGAPAVTVEYQAAGLARGATFRAHESIVDEAPVGLALQPGGGMWSRSGIENVNSSTARLSAKLRHLSTLGIFVAVDLPAELTADRETLVFGEVEDGQSRDLNVTVSNGGDAALNATAMVSGEGFSLVSSGDVTIPSGGSVVLTVRFDPDSAGNYSGTLQVSSGIGGELSVALSGTALAPGKTSSNTGCGTSGHGANGAAADILVAIGVLGMLAAASRRRRIS